jgi:uncharacterized membrane protein
MVGVVVGVLLVLAGVTFGLQGVGVLSGSAMSGKTTWAVLGPLIALVGVVLIVVGLRGSSRASSAARRSADDTSGTDTAAS